MLTAYARAYRTRRRQGRCYELALKILQSNVAGAAFLAHGTVLGDTGHARRQRIGHAWLLVGDGAIIYEPVTDQFYTPSDWMRVYAAIEVRRYSRIEAVKAALASNNYGPWHDR